MFRNRQGSEMTETTNSIQELNLPDPQVEEYYENLISYIRSRLNIIGTSVYLLETNWFSRGEDVSKYFRKINEEMESIRRLINM
jgi:hypothetical protein